MLARLKWAGQDSNLHAPMGPGFSPKHFVQGGAPSQAGQPIAQPTHRRSAGIPDVSRRVAAADRSPLPFGSGPACCCSLLSSPPLPMTGLGRMVVFTAL